MDQTSQYLLCVFEDVLAVLNKHHLEGGAAEALEYLKAAQYNYKQRDIDRMLMSLILAVQQTSKLPPAVVLEIQKEISKSANLRSETASRMMRLAQDYEASGGKLLSLPEVLEEVSRRRGSPE